MKHSSPVTRLLLCLSFEEVYCGWSSLVTPFLTVSETILGELNIIAVSAIFCFQKNRETPSVHSRVIIQCKVILCWKIPAFSLYTPKSLSKFFNWCIQDWLNVKNHFSYIDRKKIERKSTIVLSVNPDGSCFEVKTLKKDFYRVFFNYCKSVSFEYFQICVIWKM